jgi:hypothetical protein
MVFSTACTDLKFSQWPRNSRFKLTDVVCRTKSLLEVKTQIWGHCGCLWFCGSGCVPTGWRSHCALLSFGIWRCARVLSFWTELRNLCKLEHWWLVHKNVVLPAAVLFALFNFGCILCSNQHDGYGDRGFTGGEWSVAAIRYTPWHACSVLLLLCPISSFRLTCLWTPSSR